MSELAAAEDPLLKVLRHLEPYTPFAEVLAESSRGRAVRLDRTGTSLSAAPLLSGAIFRAWAGDHWHELAASDLSPRALGRAAEELVGHLRATTQARSPPGPPETGTSEDLRPPARPLEELGDEERVERVRSWFGWATSVDGITNATAVLASSDQERIYLNSAGARRHQRLFRAHAVVNPIAMEGRRIEHDAFLVGGEGGQELLEPMSEERVRETARSARALLDAEAPPTGAMNVVLDPSTTGTLAHESFGHGTEADQFVRHRSYLQPILGREVGPSFLSIADDGGYPSGYGTLRFDDEGRPTHRTLMVDRGRFVAALHDRTSAATLGATPTGNARRADFLSREFVRMTNTFVLPGELSREELVQQAGDGILLEHCSSGMEDPLGGQMQIKVRKGHLIRSGRLTGLVRSMALSGRVLDVLRDVRGVGRAEEFEMSPGFCGKGHGDYLPVGTGGSFLLTRAIVGPG